MKIYIITSHLLFDTHIEENNSTSVFRLRMKTYKYTVTNHSDSNYIH